MKTRDKVKAINAKIRPQFHESPQGKLMFGIVASAIEDAFIRSVNHDNAAGRASRNAMRYLQSGMVHASLANVDAEWIRDMIERAGFKVRGVKV